HRARRSYRTGEVMCEHIGIEGNNPLLAVMQGGDYVLHSNSFTASIDRTVELITLQDDGNRGVPRCPDCPSCLASSSLIHPSCPCARPFRGSSSEVHSTLRDLSV